MRKRGKTFLITSETHEVIILRGGRQRTMMIAFCRSCSADVGLLSFDAAMGFAGLSGRDLTRGIEAGRIHSVETSDDCFGVCRRSLEREKENVREKE